VPELLLLRDDTPLLRCPLHGQTVTVGKSPANDISIPDDDAPPLLCSFEPCDDGYRVVSRGGRTLAVNDDDTQDHALADGDRVTLGRLTARYVGRSPLDEATPRGGAQRTGILRTDPSGQLERTELGIALPPELGGGRLEVPDAGLRLGAAEDNDVVVDDGFTSSFPAQIYAKGERLFVRDLDSTNGTFVDGVRVIEAELKPGAVLRLGQVELGVAGESKPEPVEAPSGDGPWRCGEMITADAKLAKTFTLIEKVAAHDATACVFGETGTGKELVARALHQLSARSKKPLIALNCAALPANLIEAELFGHEKGAFTGADRARAGAFEQAASGTLFLDEVGELPMEMQSKLLRVLEERRVRRLGGRSDIAVDVRLVAATHRDLVARVAEGEFREDLLHRLYVIPLRLSALRERRDDVALLARHFARAFHPDGRDVEVTPAADAKLRAHGYPGNVRELRNVVQRALIMGDGERIDDDDVEFVPTTLADQQLAGEVYRSGMTMEDIEREAYRGALDAYGTAAEAARALGLPKTTFWRRAKSLGLLQRD
jgi:DNA-binding NtrC family response regulator